MIAQRAQAQRKNARRRKRARGLAENRVDLIAASRYTGRVKPLLLRVFVLMAAGFLVAAVAFADKVTLKSGEALTGEIVGDTDEHLIMELKNSGGEMKRVKKSDISFIERSAPAGDSSGAAQLSGHPLGNDPLSPFSFSGNALDFVIAICRSRNLRVSIDPQVLRALTKIAVDIPTPSRKPAIELIEGQLKAHGIVVDITPLTLEMRVAHLTTPAVQTYLRAMTMIREGKSAQAHKMLAEQTLDSSFFARHCQELKKVLGIVLERLQQINALDAQLNRDVQNFVAIKAQLNQLADLEARGAARPGSTQAKYQEALTAARNSHGSLRGLAREILASNEAVGRRFVVAQDAGLDTEAYFLVEYLFRTISFLRSKEQYLVQAELVERTEDSLGELAGEMRGVLEEYKRDIDAAETALQSALKSLGKNDEDAYSQFKEACWQDETLVQARVGYGYLLLQFYMRSLDKFFAPTDAAARETRLEKAQRFFRQYDKPAMLHTLRVTSGEAVTKPPVLPSAKIGTAKGLAVSSKGGGLFPLWVRIEAVQQPARSPLTDRRRNTFNALRDEQFGPQTRSAPIAFEDYGEKDLHMEIAAVEAYKWLQSLDENLNGERGLKIGFHSLFAGKAGDSAGITIALAGYSSLKQLPLRADTAMTGSIRSDGAVKAVGSVPQKISGALSSPGIERVIVPKENETDLLFLPIDELCAIAIIVADDMSTCLAYAVKSTDKSAEEADGAIQKLREAQALLLLGDPAAARKILVLIADEHPEIYTARRLLELINNNERAKSER
jgi:hypothetical protein